MKWYISGNTTSAAGKQGGKETGQKMDHLIEDGGHFQQACGRLIAMHPAILYSDRALEKDETRKKKLASKKAGQ